MPASRHILIVEDDTDIRATLGALLVEEGFRVSTARDGRDALALLRSGAPPDVILLDLMMPVMDGATFRNAQLQDPALAGIPVVLITASLGPRQAVGALRPAAVLAKPFDVEDVVQAIDRVARSPAPSSHAQA